MIHLRRLAWLLAIAAAGCVLVAGPACSQPASATGRAATPAATSGAETQTARPTAAAPPRKASDELVRTADEVAKQVEALRGWTFKKPVRKQVCTPDEARAYLDKEIAKQCPDEKVARTQTFLRMVGLLPPDCDVKKVFLDILQGQVAGFYDTDAQALCMVERQVHTPAVVEKIMLAHELTHALDDQHCNIRDFVKKHAGQTEDMDLVVASVVEGSATSLMVNYMTRLVLSGQVPPDELQKYSVEEAARSESLLHAPRYFLSLLGVYMCGQQFLARGNLLAMMTSADNKAIGENFLAAVKAPPRSTEQILHPEKYWDAAKRDEPIVIDDKAAVKLLERPGRYVVHKDTLGEMLCALATLPHNEKPNLMAMQLASSWTNEAARGWGGDRFYLVASGRSAKEAARTQKDARGVWFTFWDTATDREEFLRTYEAATPDAEKVIVRMGTMAAVILFGFPEAERADLAARLEKSPPPMRRSDGKPWTPWAL